MGQVMQKPIVLAGMELAFAAGSLVFSSMVVSSCVKLLCSNFIAKADRDQRLKIQVGLDTIRGVLSIAFYGGLSQQQLPGKMHFQLFPSFPHVAQVPFPRAIVGGCLTLALSPLACVFIGGVSLPVIKLFHSGFKIDPKAEENMIITNRDDVGRSLPATQVPANNDGTRTASAEPVPTTMETPIQISVGTQMGPMLEAAVPGHVTIVMPLCEEIFYRGLLFGRLVPSIGFLPAALGSSAFFGFLHKGLNGSTYFPVSETILGFACSLFYFCTGHLLVPIALHSGLNSCLMLVSAMQSAPRTVGIHWIVSKCENKVFMSASGLSFWERRVAKNLGAFGFVASLLASWLMKDANTLEGGPSFLPLDFWGAEEPASPQSVFYDRQNERLLRAPALCNVDGSTTEFAELLIGDLLTSLFGDEDSISLDKLIAYNIDEFKLQFAFHILATTPQQMESPPRVVDCYNYCKSLEGEQNDNFSTKLYHRIGIAALSHPSGKITRSELKELCYKDLRLGFHSEVNEYYFIFYCLVKMKMQANLTIPELLKGYCDLPSALRRHNAEGVKETVSGGSIHKKTNKED